jgi:hypothetical protein
MAPHPPTRFTQADAERAADEWGCNCGPSALAAILQLTLGEVRPLMGDFESKRYTNPTLMFQSLDRAAGLWHWHRRPDRDWPRYGLARIQWTGPWTKPGVPARVAYRQTHWVGAMRGAREIGVFDINMIANGTGWGSLMNWETILVPWLLKEAVPRADGGWFITHSVEVERR